jgi:antirestriction protein ArdC
MIDNAPRSNQWDVYATITSFFRMQLISGIVPWHVSWHRAGIPRNAITGQPYRSANLWILHSLGFKQNRFLTKKQVQSIGAEIKVGEMGYVVLKHPDIIATRDAPGANDEELYELLNIEQCDNLPTSLLAYKLEERKYPHRICNAIILGMPKTKRDKERSTILVDVTDCINFPSYESFDTADGGFASLFHMFVHGTSSPDRLNRTYEKERKESSFPTHLMEELVADMGTAYLCSHAGIPIPCNLDTKEYAEAFSRFLELHPRFIFQASMYAQEAVEYILSIQRSADYVSQEEVDQFD